MGQLREKVCAWMDFQANKHEHLGHDFAECQVNGMSNYELLCAIDEAIEELLNEGDSLRSGV